MAQTLVGSMVVVTVSHAWGGPSRDNRRIHMDQKQLPVDGLTDSTQDCL